MTGSEENLPLDMKSVDRHLGSFVPSARLRRWLLIGISALVVDLVLGVASTVLEFQHWGEEGVTTDVILMLVAIIPQCFVAATYLVLACESQCRGLWKSTAGMLGSYLLLCVYGVVLLEVLQDSGNVAIMVLVAVGLVGLFAFSVSGIPRFGADDADCVSKKICQASNQTHHKASAGSAAWPCFSSLLSCDCFFGVSLNRHSGLGWTSTTGN